MKTILTVITLLALTLYLSFAWGFGQANLGMRPTNTMTALQGTPEALTDSTGDPLTDSTGDPLTALP